jgi:pyocin large subunit-like protein
MKKNGKKLGLGGTLLVIVLYLVLAKMGLIAPAGGDNEESTHTSLVVENTQKPQVTKAPEVATQPEETKAPKATKAPKPTKEPVVTEAPKVTATPKPTKAPVVTEAPTEEPEMELTNYWFRTKSLRDSHFEKHGIEMGFETPEEYIEAANRVICNPDALHKLEAEDNDHVYFIEETNEFVVLSQDGYLRTYYIANGGIDYFNRQ